MATEFKEINDPKSWEKYFKTLLKYHLGQANVFDIPDQNEGDWGRAGILNLGFLKGKTRLYALFCNV